MDLCTRERESPQNLVARENSTPAKIHRSKACRWHQRLKLNLEYLNFVREILPVQIEQGSGQIDSATAALRATDDSLNDLRWVLDLKTVAFWGIDPTSDVSYVQELVDIESWEIDLVTVAFWEFELAGVALWEFDMGSVALWEFHLESVALWEFDLASLASREFDLASVALWVIHSDMGNNLKLNLECGFWGSKKRVMTRRLWMNQDSEGEGRQTHRLLSVNVRR